MANNSGILIVFVVLLNLTLKCFGLEIGHFDNKTNPHDKSDLEMVTNFLHRVTRTVDLQEAGVDLVNLNHPFRFFGLACKWKFGIWVKPFTLYTAKLQYAYPINLPFNLFRPGINPPVLFKREGETSDEESQLQEIKRRNRREARQERSDFYRSLEPIMQTFGLEAKSCVLRAICEAAEIPFEEGLLGDTINVLLKASIVGRPESRDEEEYGHYIEAELNGKRHGNCHEIYFNCTQSIFDIIPGLQHEIVSDHEEL